MSNVERLTPHELTDLFLFESLEQDKLEFLAERGQVVEYPAGAVIHAEGNPATAFMILLSGMLAMSRRVQGGELELFRTDYCGAYTGAFNAWFADNPEFPQIYLSTARAVTGCRMFELPANDFGRAFREWFPMAAHLLEGASTQGRVASDTVARHEQLVALGSVTAGLTHELNNPVAAVMRATATLRERLSSMREDLGRVITGGLSQSQLEGIGEMAGRAIEGRHNAPPYTALESSDREDELGDWLDDHGVENGWELAPTMVAAGLDVEWLEDLAKIVPDDKLQIGLKYPVRALESDGLLDEITEASGRIASLLKQAKQYTQMDRAPLQSFDVHEGLDSTLTMLGHKIGDHIDVVRDYDRGLPDIPAYPGELNQVWTNLIDNAVDAMDGHGVLTVRTRRDGEEQLMVEIGDTGPGVPAEMRSRVFEPFFTTKGLGQGTGLGLDIARRIVVGRHRGDIRIESSPGDTRFQVFLPLHEPEPQG